MHHVLEARDLFHLLRHFCSENHSKGEMLTRKSFRGSIIRSSIREHRLRFNRLAVMLRQDLELDSQETIVGTLSELFSLPSIPLLSSGDKFEEGVNVQLLK